MKSRTQERPRGQVLLITAFSMIVLIGITALVIDLGVSWMLRRQEQNAAETRIARARRNQHAFRFQLAKIRAMRILIDHDLFHWPSIANQCNRVHHLLH